MVLIKLMAKKLLKIRFKYTRKKDRKGEWHIKKEKILLTDAKGKTLKSFIYNKNIKILKDFNNQKQANEKVIVDYYKRHEGEAYKPTSSKEFIDKINILLNDDKKIKKFNTKEFKWSSSRVVYTKEQRLKKFKWCYVVVELRIHLNGSKFHAMGRSDYLRNKIPDGFLSTYIYQATRRALAPYGSNLRFDFIWWSYAYYQEYDKHYV